MNLHDRPLCAVHVDLDRANFWRVIQIGFYLDGSQSCSRRWLVACDNGRADQGAVARAGLTYQEIESSALSDETVGDEMTAWLRERGCGAMALTFGSGAMALTHQIPAFQYFGDRFLDMQSVCNLARYARGIDVSDDIGEMMRTFIDSRYPCPRDAIEKAHCIHKLFVTLGLRQMGVEESACFGYAAIRQQSRAYRALKKG